MHLFMHEECRHWRPQLEPSLRSAEQLAIRELPHKIQTAVHPASLVDDLDGILIDVVPKI